MIFKIADMIGRICDSAVKRAVIEDAVDRSGVAVDVSKLPEAVFRNVILGDGQSVVVEAKI